MLPAGFSTRRLSRALQEFAKGNHTRSPARLFSEAVITPGSVDRTILLPNILRRKEAP